MTELDLSLLTDEERGWYDLALQDEGSGAKAMLQAYAALIAARAENKRLRDALHTIFMTPSEYSNWKQADLVNALEAAQMLAQVALGYGVVEDDAAALLQPKKEGE